MKEEHKEIIGQVIINTAGVVTFCLLPLVFIFATTYFVYESFKNMEYIKIVERALNGKFKHIKFYVSQKPCYNSYLIKSYETNITIEIDYINFKIFKMKDIMNQMFSTIYTKIENRYNDLLMLDLSGCLNKEETNELILIKQQLNKDGSETNERYF